MTAPKGVLNTIQSRINKASTDDQVKLGTIQKSLNDIQNTLNSGNDANRNALKTFLPQKLREIERMLKNLSLPTTTGSEERVKKAGRLHSETEDREVVPLNETVIPPPDQLTSLRHRRHSRSSSQGSSILASMAEPWIQGGRKVVNKLQRTKSRGTLTDVAEVRGESEQEPAPTLPPLPSFPSGSTQDLTGQSSLPFHQFGTVPQAPATFSSQPGASAQAPNPLVPPQPSAINRNLVPRPSFSSLQPHAFAQDPSYHPSFPSHQPGAITEAPNPFSLPPIDLSTQQTLVSHQGRPQSGSLVQAPSLGLPQPGPSTQQAQAQHQEHPRFAIGPPLAHNPSGLTLSINVSGHVTFSRHPYTVLLDNSIKVGDGTERYANYPPFATGLSQEVTERFISELMDLICVISEEKYALLGQTVRRYMCMYTKVAVLTNQGDANYACPRCVDLNRICLKKIKVGAEYVMFIAPRENSGHRLSELGAWVKDVTKPMDLPPQGQR
jgi:hypothetical protein